MSQNILIILESTAVIKEADVRIERVAAGVAKLADADAVEPANADAVEPADADAVELADTDADNNYKI
jgi:hypothetical protein